MSYRSLRECIEDLERHGHLLRITEEVDPDLDMAAIHRIVFQAGGPAVYYEKVRHSPFPAVSNLFGTEQRSRFIFRKTLKRVCRMVELKARPAEFLKNPLRYACVLSAALQALPLRTFSAPVLQNRTTIANLPQVRCWPQDGGAFILLPQVYTENPDMPGIWHSNLGMYRVQLGGNEYTQDREVGLHYQIRRDIGIHHAAALRRGEPLKVSIFVGGPPAHTFSAVMHLPEKVPEVLFAGALAGRGFRYTVRDGFVVSADADFCITGYVDPGRTLPEGPFGDHLGYYSLQHDFPVMRVENVWHRSGAIWPFTVVGRPPQEDTAFGGLVQKIAEPMLPVEIPGVHAVHAVDEAGVHPLLLVEGSERYVPWQDPEPREILTQANAVLGYGPCSLAKYVFIAARQNDGPPPVQDTRGFLMHVLERIDWRRDLHFQTHTTIDTLDYSGTGLNRGSKVVLAACGTKKRTLCSQWNPEWKLPGGFSGAGMILPGISVLAGPAFTHYTRAAGEMDLLCHALEKPGRQGLALVVVCDDPHWTRQRWDRFLWITFTRSNPSHDIHGPGSSIDYKHWGCQGPLVIDARIKPHHAPPLEETAPFSEALNRLMSPGGPLHPFVSDQG